MKQPMIRAQVYDVIQRLLHWWIAGSIVLLGLTGFFGSRLDPGAERSYFWLWHITVGKLLAFGFVGRLVWGVIGPTHARFSALIHIKSWISTLKKPKMESADGPFGHHPQASLSSLGFYLLCAGSTLSGLLLAGMLYGETYFASRLFDSLEFHEPLIEAHELLFWAILFFVITHLGAIIFHEYKDRIPIAQSMLSGFQYRSDKENKYVEIKKTVP